MSLNVKDKLAYEPSLRPPNRIFELKSKGMLSITFTEQIARPTNLVQSTSAELKSVGHCDKADTIRGSAINRISSVCY